MAPKTIPAVVLGGSGYVAAEMLGLLFNHRSFRIDAVVSTSHAGERVDQVFPHLAGPAGDFAFWGWEDARELLRSTRQRAVFSALPHGTAAIALAGLLAECPAARVVDVSADFRHSSPERFAAIYGGEHGAPDLLPSFVCALPDLPGETPEAYLSHPGCFTTGATLAIAPLLAGGWIEPTVQISAVTGSTGAGRQPGPGTHHPHRQSSMWAYQPLTHRHRPEIESLLQAFHPGVEVAFVPHSGPFARGIHTTAFAELRRPAHAEEIVESARSFFSASPFVRVSTQMPTLKEIVGTNRCHIGVAVEGRRLVATSVIDNLVKGAAGGAVQWMNRLFALEEKEGLDYAVPGWI